MENGYKDLVIKDTEQLLNQGDEVDTKQAVRHILKVQLFQIQQYSDLSEDVKKVVEYQVRYPSITWLMLHRPRHVAIAVAVVLIVLVSLFSADSLGLLGQMIRQFLGL